MNKFTYTTHGTCSRQITFEIDDDNIVHNVKFVSGCSGNTQGISRLVEGLAVDEVIKRLKGIHCGYKNTSCPDQLSKALEASLECKPAPESLSANSAQ